jgi:hypothetical protein
MDIAIDYVKSSAREEFARRHAGWGTTVRIVDVEFAGMTTLDKDSADVLLNVSWQRAADSQLRVTQVAQRWYSDKGSWQVTGEQRRAGDVGLLGETEAPSKESPEEAQSRRARFRTRVISDRDE